MARVSNLRGPGPGRPKGCRNHVTLELKEMIEKALMKAGGVRYLEEQAKANPSAFLTLVAKLLPRDVNLQGKIGSVGKVARQTFEAATGLYLEERKLFKAPKTYITEFERSKPLKAFFGDTPLKRITPGLILKYQTERRDKALAGKCAAILALNTTMPGCELKGLRRKDVDLFEKTLTIRRETTKTDAGNRVIPLNRDAVLALSELLTRAEQLGAGEPDHFIFPACECGVIDPTKPMKGWRNNKGGTEGASFPRPEASSHHGAL